jgi:hypothetical protein
MHMHINVGGCWKTTVSLDDLLVCWLRESLEHPAA